MVAFQRIIQKMTLRVFASPGGGGGNPVTVFLYRNGQRLKESTEKTLAKSCEWESVVAHVHTRTESSLDTLSGVPTFSFFMPSGEEVSFCAHATMGALFAVSSSQESQTTELKYRTSLDSNIQHGTICGQRVGLRMNAAWEEESVPNNVILKSLLTNHLGLTDEDFTHPSASVAWPTFCNSSVARPKTLVYVSSAETLHRAQPPSDAESFREGCDAIHSTGLYLYCPMGEADGSEWECRQFPRASGYPEDPATGIAASALAVSLHERGCAIVPTYNMYQGIAMGRPSLISVQNIRVRNGTVSFKCDGSIELDDHTEIQVDDK